MNLLATIKKRYRPLFNKDDNAEIVLVVVPPLFIAVVLSLYCQWKDGCGLYAAC